MKANHIPVQERLLSRIRKMEYVEADVWVPKKYYPYCRHCHITNVQLSIDGDHYQGCPIRGWAKQIAYYKMLLAST